VFSLCVCVCVEQIRRALGAAGAAVVLQRLELDDGGGRHPARRAVPEWEGARASRGMVVAWALRLASSLTIDDCVLCGRQDYYPPISMLGQTTFVSCIVLTYREINRDLTEANRIMAFLARQRVSEQLQKKNVQVPQPQPRSHVGGKLKPPLAPGVRDRITDTPCTSRP
jgi:hypothetical protein